MYSDSDYSSLDPKDWQVFAGDYDFSKSENSEQQRGLKVIIKHDKNFQFWRSGHPEYPDDFDIGRDVVADVIRKKLSR